MIFDDQIEVQCNILNQDTGLVYVLFYRGSKTWGLLGYADRIRKKEIHLHLLDDNDKWVFCDGEKYSIYGITDYEALQRGMVNVNLIRELWDVLLKKKFIKYVR